MTKISRDERGTFLNACLHMLSFICLFTCMLVFFLSSLWLLLLLLLPFCFYHAFLSLLLLKSKLGIVNCSGLLLFSFNIYCYCLFVIASFCTRLLSTVFVSFV